MKVEIFNPDIWKARVEHLTILTTSDLRYFTQRIIDMAHLRPLRQPIAICTDKKGEFWVAYNDKDSRKGLKRIALLSRDHMSNGFTGAAFDKLTVKVAIALGRPQPTYEQTTFFRD